VIASEDDFRLCGSASDVWIVGYAPPEVIAVGLERDERALLREIAVDEKVSDEQLGRSVVHYGGRGPTDVPPAAQLLLGQPVRPSLEDHGGVWDDQLLVVCEGAPSRPRHACAQPLSRGAYPATQLSNRHTTRQDDARSLASTSFVDEFYAVGKNI
jgi:hypothetical protein